MAGPFHSKLRRWRTRDDIIISDADSGDIAVEVALTPRRLLPWSRGRHRRPAAAASRNKTRRWRQGGPPVRGTGTPMVEDALPGCIWTSEAAGEDAPAAPPPATPRAELRREGSRRSWSWETDESFDRLTATRDESVDS